MGIKNNLSKREFSTLRWRRELTLIRCRFLFSTVSFGVGRPYIKLIVSLYRTCFSHLRPLKKWKVPCTVKLLEIRTLALPLPFLRCCLKMRNRNKTIEIRARHTSKWQGAGGGCVQKGWCGRKLYTFRPQIRTRKKNEKKKEGKRM